MLDRSIPFETVHGLPGVAFAQGGRLFDASGHQVGGGEAGEEQGPPPGPGREQAPQGGSGAAAGSSPGDADDGRGDGAGGEGGGPVDYARMHWTQLKAMVETYGGTWTGKADAIAFLKGKTA